FTFSRLTKASRTGRLSFCASRTGGSSIPRIMHESPPPLIFFDGAPRPGSMDAEVLARQPCMRRGNRRDRGPPRAAPRPGRCGPRRPAEARPLRAAHGSGGAARRRELALGARAAGAAPLARHADAGAAPAHLAARGEAAPHAEAV